MQYCFRPSCAQLLVVVGGAAGGGAPVAHEGSRYHTMKRAGMDSPTLAPTPRIVTKSSSAFHGSGGQKRADKGVVEVTKRRWITSACKGKNRWFADLKSEVLRWLDISVISFAQQHCADWETVLKILSAKWEYVGHPDGVDEQCVEGFAKVILKQERWKLHALWKKGGSQPRMAAPPLTDPVQWSKLVHHFMSDAGRTKSANMTIARSNVENPNFTGRKGCAPIAEQLVSGTWKCGVVHLMLKSSTLRCICIALTMCVSIHSNNSDMLSCPEKQDRANPNKG